jgi:hypothetical protein
MRLQHGFIGIALVGLGIYLGVWIKTPAPQAAPPEPPLSLSFKAPNLNLSFSADFKPAAKAESGVPGVFSRLTLNQADRVPCQAQWDRAIQFNLDKLGRETGYLQMTTGALEGVLESLKSLTENENCAAPATTTRTFAAEAREHCKQAMEHGKPTTDNPFQRKQLVEACLNGFARYRAAAIRESFRGRDIQTIQDVPTLVALYLAERERTRNGPAADTEDTDSLTTMGRSSEILNRILALDPNHPVALRYRIEVDLMVESIQCWKMKVQSSCPLARETVDEELRRLHKVAPQDPFTLAFLIERAIYRTDYPSAERYAAHLLKIGEEAAAGYYQAWVQHERGNRKAAEALLTRATSSQKPATNFWTLPIGIVLDDLRQGKAVVFPPFSLPVSHAFEVPNGAKG